MAVQPWYFTVNIQTYLVPTIINMTSLQQLLLTSSFTHIEYTCVRYTCIAKMTEKHFHTYLRMNLYVNKHTILFALKENIDPKMRVKYIEEYCSPIGRL